MQRNVGRRLCRSGCSMGQRLQNWSLPREPCDVCASLPRQQRGSPRSVAVSVSVSVSVDFAPFRSVAGECLPLSWVYAGGLHVSLQLISVTLQWATKSPRTGRKFRVEDSLRDPAVRHSMHMANPAKLRLKNESLCDGDAATA